MVLTPWVCRAAPDLAPVAASVASSATIPGSASASARDTGGELIRVSPSGASFETSETRRGFTPFGGIYYDPATYTDEPFPRFLLITGFDAERTRKHFAQIAGLGANIIRISLSTGVFSPGYGKTREEAFETLDTIIALAREHGLRVVLDLMVEWEGGADWMAPASEMFTDERALAGLQTLYGAFADRYRENFTVFSYLLCDEAKIPWGSNGLHAGWTEWVHGEYDTEGRLKEAWQDYPWSKETWDNLIPPADENAPGSRRLYDYQRYREDVAAGFVARLGNAIRERDPNHMISVGLLQWNVPLRPPIDDAKLLKPSSYPGFKPRKIAPYVDYVHINCYNWWDEKTPQYARALGSYCTVPGKPVILGEFSFDPQVVKETRDLFSGYFAWAFYPLPSEPVHHYLFDANGEPTVYAESYSETAREFSTGEHKPAREAAEEALKVDAVQVFTDIPSMVELYERYIERSGNGTAPSPLMREGWGWGEGEGKPTD